MFDCAFYQQMSKNIIWCKHLFWNPQSGAGRLLIFRNRISDSWFMFSFHALTTLHLSWLCFLTSNSPGCISSAWNFVPIIYEWKAATFRPLFAWQLSRFLWTLSSSIRVSGLVPSSTFRDRKLRAYLFFAGPPRGCVCVRPGLLSFFSCSKCKL